MYVLGTVDLNEILELVVMVFKWWWWYWWWLCLPPRGIWNVFLVAPVTWGLYWHW